MTIKIVLGTDNQFYFMADNKVIHKLSQQDLKLVIPTTKSGTMEILRKSSMEKNPVPYVPRQLPPQPQKCFNPCNYFYEKEVIEKPEPATKPRRFL